MYCHLSPNCATALFKTIALNVWWELAGNFNPAGVTFKLTTHALFVQYTHRYNNMSNMAFWKKGCNEFLCLRLLLQQQQQQQSDPIPPISGPNGTWPVLFASSRRQSRPSSHQASL